MHWHMHKATTCTALSNAIAPEGGTPLARWLGRDRTTCLGEASGRAGCCRSTWTSCAGCEIVLLCHGHGQERTTPSRSTVCVSVRSIAEAGRAAALWPLPYWMVTADNCPRHRPQTTVSLKINHVNAITVRAATPPVKSPAVLAELSQPRLLRLRRPEAPDLQN